MNIRTFVAMTASPFYGSAKRYDLRYRMGNKFFIFPALYVPEQGAERF
jgi:hypothetical protein